MHVALFAARSSRSHLTWSEPLRHLRPRTTAVPVEHDHVPGPHGRPRTRSVRPGRRRCPCTPASGAPPSVWMSWLPVTANRIRSFTGPHEPPKQSLSSCGRPVLVGGVAERGDHAGQARRQRAGRVVVRRVAATDVAGGEEHRRRRALALALGVGVSVAAGPRSRSARPRSAAATVASPASSTSPAETRDAPQPATPAARRGRPRSPASAAGSERPCIAVRALVAAAPVNEPHERFPEPQPAPGRLEFEASHGGTNAGQCTGRSGRWCMS